MPPKAKVTREDVVEAGFDVVREGGLDKLNAREVARRAGCSTQPVMSNFPTMDELKRAVYARADSFHTDYLLRPRGDDPFLGAGLNYLRFAIEEAPLFRFLFQSDFSPHATLLDAIDADAVAPLLTALQAEADLTEAQARDVFATLALTVHGYACLLSNQHLAYDEPLATSLLTRAFRGAIYAATEWEEQ